MLLPAIMKHFAVLVTLVLVLVLEDVSGYEEKDFIEMKCKRGEPASTPHMDMAWMMSVKTWYYNYASQLDLYRSVAQVIRTPISELRDHDVYYKSCCTFDWHNPKGPIYYMYGKEEPVVWNPDGKGGFIYSNDFINVGGLTTFPLTDNKTYMYFFDCWDDDVASWGVISTVPVLPDETLKTIHDYAKSLGFKEKHFMALRYEMCDLASQGVGVDMDNMELSSSEKDQQSDATKTEL